MAVRTKKMPWINTWLSDPLHGIALLYAASGSVYGLAAVWVVTRLVPPERAVGAGILLGCGFLALSTLCLVQAARHVRLAARRDVQALRVSEERYRLIAESSTDVIWTLDVRGRTTYVSPSVKRLRGFSPQEVLALPHEQSATSSSAGALRDGMAAIMAQVRGLAPDQPVTAEIRQPCKDGPSVWVEVLARVMRDSQGQALGVLGVSRDITPRRQAEEALRRLQAEQQAVLDALPACVFRKDCENRVVWANQAMLELTGVSREQILGRTGFELFPPEVAQRFWDDDQEVIRSGRPKTDILEHVRGADGEERWYATRKIPWLDEDGNVVGILGCSVDVTSLREAEAARQRSEERFRTVFAAAPVGIVIVDEQCRALDANPAYERILGYTLAELQALPNLLALASPPEREAEAARFHHVVTETGASPASELHLVRKDDQPICVRHVGTAVYDAEDRFLYAMAMIEDITHTKSMEERLRLSQKLESLACLAGGVAHDFNNLLQVILGCINETLDGMAGDSPLRVPLSQSEQAAKRAAGLTRQLLALSRQQILRPERLDLDALVEDLMKLLPRMVGSAIDIEFRPGEGVHAVRADPVQIEQILTNLCVNARDAMPTGGRLTITTTALSLDEPYCATHDWARPGRYAALRVVDTGIGMDRATRERAFDPFFTTKDVGKGTGLGLAVAYGIARQHGGTVTVESAPGQGSTFTLFLPCTDLAALPQVPAQPSARGSGETILVAEDEELVRDICRRILERAGYRVLTANDGAEAVRLVEQHPGGIDLLLFDVIMPGLNGRDAYVAIRRDIGPLPCVFVSGYVQADYEDALPSGPGLRRLHKPYESEALLRSVREALLTHPGNAGRFDSAITPT